MENKNYYVGLDIGTDSVGYAVTDERYELCKFKGEPMWGMETKQGTVLYYCLEDTLKRIQQRLYCITENAPDNLLFEIAIFFFTCNLKTFAIIFIKKFGFFICWKCLKPNLPQIFPKAFL